MKNSLLLFTTACIIFILFSNCHSAKRSQKGNYARHSRKPATHTSGQPKFIEHVALGHTANTGGSVQTKRPGTKQPKSTPQSTRTATASAKPGAVPRVKETQSPAPPENMSRRATNQLFGKYAEMMGVRTKDIDNLVLYSFIDKWYGTEYKMGGCDVSGIDCSGFAQKLYSEVYGIDLLRTSVEQFQHCKRIRSSAYAEEGDLIFFRVSGKKISHVGIYLINDFFVHASTSNGVMISNLHEDYWQSTYAGIGRLPRS